MVNYHIASSPEDLALCLFSAHRRSRSVLFATTHWSIFATSIS